MKLQPIHYEILENLDRSRSLENLTRLSKITKYQERLGKAVRQLEDEGLITLVGKGYAGGQKYRRVI
jgi:vacuolar-type H+-ATPase subunit C/Vma6